MIAKFILSFLIAQSPLAGFGPMPSTDGAQGLRFEVNKDQKKVNKPNKNKGKPKQKHRKGNNRNNQGGGQRRPKVISTTAKVVKTITLEERATDRLNAMVSSSGDLGAKQNFLEQKKVREQQFVLIEGERQRFKQLLVEGRLSAQDLNSVQSDGFTIFHHVVISGWGDIASRMIEVGADPDVKDASGRSARDWARTLGYSSMTALFDAKKPRQP